MWLLCVKNDARAKKFPAYVNNKYNECNTCKKVLFRYSDMISLVKSVRF